MCIRDRSQTVVINPNDTQELYFYNNPIGGIEIIKVNASKTSERIPDTTFEIRRMDDALVDTITTDKNGRAYLCLLYTSYISVCLPFCSLMFLPLLGWLFGADV